MSEKQETWAEKVARLQREIAERQWQLHYLILGDQSKGVSVHCTDITTEPRK